mgnify:CR=1 FL=1
MAFDFNGTTDRADWANPYSIPSNNNEAISTACWWYPDSVAADQYLWCVHQSGDTAVAFLANNLGGGDLQIYRETRRRNTSGAGFVTGSWQHVCCTLTATNAGTGIRVFRNGVETSYGTAVNDNTVPAGAGSWSVGGRIFDDTRNLNGRLAGFGYWNRVLDNFEIPALALGYHPLCFPRGLKWAPDLIRAQRDYVSGQTGTLDGTAVIEHPSVIFPKSTIIVGKTTAVPTVSLIYRAPFTSSFGAIIGR